MNTSERQQQIHEKGFDLFGSNFSNNKLEDFENFSKKVKIGTKTLQDISLNLGQYKKISYCGSRGITKEEIYNAIAQKDYEKMRVISNLFYDTNGLYERVCNYFAFLYRFDWYIAPAVFDNDAKEEKVLKDFVKMLNYLDNSYIKKICGDIALSVIKNGCYYGYLIDSNEKIILQDLPVKYCRSTFSVSGSPVVEFNMKFFDTFVDVGYRMKVLSLFPEEFTKGYALYKKGKLPVDNNLQIGYGSWYILDPERSVKFNFNGSDIPAFINSIPAIIDLDAAQELDRKKQMQQLLKILIQKLPLDKNNDLIFDSDEARDIHNNTVEMLAHTIGVDVVTTFADIDSIDLSDRNISTTKDDLEKIEREVFNSMGISQNLFNTDGNLSLEKSILNDESTVRNLLLQFRIFFDKIIKKKNQNIKKYDFKFYMLETTQYNYQALSKLYKEQTQIGYSKMLPQIALGHSQSFILNTVYFENNILNLSAIMIPPLMSSTMNGDALLGRQGSQDGNKTQKNQGKEAAAAQTEGKAVGRPEKPEGEKSEKTLQNLESMS